MSLAFYTNIMSGRPGDLVGYHASSSNPNCVLEVARVGRLREIVLQSKPLAAGQYETPTDADRNGCGWPEAGNISIGSEWKSGYYDLCLRNASGEEAHHFLCVKPHRRRPTSTAALILSTNTYHAYNWWGGANAYCDVTSLMTRRKGLPEAME